MIEFIPQQVVEVVHILSRRGKLPADVAYALNLSVAEVADILKRPAPVTIKRHGTHPGRCYAKTVKKYTCPQCLRAVTKSPCLICRARDAAKARLARVRAQNGHG